MNAYASVGTLKSPAYLNITDTSYDAELLNLLEQSSRLIDKWCDRFFYVKSETRYFEGTSSILFADDILTVTTLKTDNDGDGTFENTFATSDYFLRPFNTYPRTRLQIDPNGDYGGFASGVIRGVEIAGTFGYGDGESTTPYVNLDSVGASFLSTATVMTVVNGNLFSAGQTIRINTEQIYVASSPTGNQIPIIKRGVNGTVAAVQTLLDPIYLYKYPEPITQACLITAMRAFKRKDTAYQDVTGSPETGQFIVAKGIDPDVKEIISVYRRRRI